MHFFIVGVLVAVVVYHIKQTNAWFLNIKYWNENGIEANDLIDLAYRNAYSNLAYSIFSLLALFLEIFLFIYCNPRLFRRSTWVNLSEEWAKNKQERAAARSAKAEADKQKRIEELQAELQELKKDE